ncbi:response regulator transcription factor [Paenibacillus koleovorans]|uniref:response regulator transcription factor n=1 Tax=Paenibacillus koleovorans TaxID=121608 RepID=UPI000FDA98A6|nr:response regulator transcription factor [Paenibacillus koleovorans]
MSKMMKVLVVDDHPLFAQATKQLLERIDRIEVVGVAGSGQLCIEAIQTTRPDIVFLDYQLPDQFGTEIAAKIKQEFPHIHIVIFTGKDINDLMNNFLELQVSGILSKESSEQTIIQLVQCIMNNHTMIPLSLFYQLRRVSKKPTVEAILTLDEVQIMSMLVKGETHEQIASQIHISKRSVDNYLKKIYQKLGVQSRIQAIEKFVQSDYYLHSLKGE